MDPGVGDQVEDRAPGIVDSIRSMVSTFLQVLHTRVELLTTELEEEMHRIAGLLLLGAVAVFFGGLFVLMVAITIIIAAGPEHRLLASVIMTLVFLAIVVTAAIMLKSRAKQHKRLLAASIEELARDRNALRRASREEAA